MIIDIHSHLLTSDYLLLFNFIICFCSLLKFRNLEYKVGLTVWPRLSNFALTFQPEPFGSAPKRPEDLHSELAETTVSATLCLQSYCANVATEKQSGCKVSPVLTVISKTSIRFYGTCILMNSFKYLTYPKVQCLQFCFVASALPKIVGSQCSPAHSSTNEHMQRNMTETF